MDNDVFYKVSVIFKDVFNDQNLEIAPEMTAADIEEWDSLNHINLIIAHEIEFGVRFTSFEISNLKDIGQFVELLESKIQK
ncbi:acyl carrier protein [bacterium]|jgi:acyl carrier protein|nr:acyl carrier protein [bacterium]